MHLFSDGGAKRTYTKVNYIEAFTYYERIIDKYYRELKEQ